MNMYLFAGLLEGLLKDRLIQRNWFLRMIKRFKLARFLFWLDQ